MGGNPARNNESKTPNIIFKTGRIGGFVDSLIVSGKIEDILCEMVVDTGSNITIVRPDMVRRISKSKIVDIKPVDSCLHMVTGDTTPVWGWGSVCVTIGGLETGQDVWIAEIENKCIFGLDFLGPNGCIVDVLDGCLRIGTEEIQLQQLGSRESREQPRCWRVYVAETMAIPAQSEALIPGRLQDGESSGEVWGSLEPTRKRGLPSEIILARTVVDLRKPRFVVRVMNLSDKERVVKKGTEEASCESVQCVTLLSGNSSAMKQEVPEFHEALQELYERSAEGLDSSQKEKLMSC
ncbi:Retrovirus-related Pol poly from transposon 412 [Paramuricea clavata]|uniref:Retrovirus-related Pol poly from transposon 412, partial n=1 Tax=Paramuricea clavata TaxID=317549 RepID=A0A6S7H7U8_PARCT|nr:Retrovirus-related Pol poly from transposon 412 [Paramuricea clavata]